MRLASSAVGRHIIPSARLSAQGPSRGLIETHRAALGVEHIKLIRFLQVVQAITVNHDALAI